MIYVTNLNGKKMMINEDLIEIIEETPDTVITMTTGKKLVIIEPIEELIDRIVKFKQNYA